MNYTEAIQVMQDARVHQPALVKLHDTYFAFSRTKVLGSGDSYAAALADAKLLPRKPRRADDAVLFAAVGANVACGTRPVCTAHTPNLALRIANALNAYTPNDRGYAAVGADVACGTRPVCTAHTPDLALRIANALNAYTPNDRGY